MQSDKAPNLNTAGQLFFSEQQAASILCQSVRTLQKWRSIGQGPAVHRFGRSVRYSRDDLFFWIKSCRTDPTSMMQSPRSSVRASDRQESSACER
ncbi:helix-turn-helix domain-containing protein [Octadecabacter sp.]|nr:helix-turn-helix domain-containing protein [Octadecabacter sp.]